MDQALEQVEVEVKVEIKVNEKGVCIPSGLSFPQPQP
jgi:hypothetical protein